MNFFEEFISIFGAGQLKEIKILTGELLSRDTAPPSPYLLFSDEGKKCFKLVDTYPIGSLLTTLKLETVEYSRKRLFVVKTELTVV